MHVIYDGRVLAYQYTGLGRFASELLFALLETCREDRIDYTVIIWEDPTSTEPNKYYTRLRACQSKGVCRILSVPCRPISLAQHFSFAKYINKLGGDAYFYPHFDLPFGICTPSVIMIHDLFPLKVPGYITKNSRLKIFYFNLMLRWVARKTDYIFALSNTSREDFLAVVGKQYSAKVGVSLAGPIVDKKEIDPTPCPKISIPNRFLLYVGDRRPHKNIKRIIDLFIMLKDNGMYDGSLMLVGSTTNHDFDIDHYIRSRTDIQVLGQVDDQTLMSLYQHMDSLVFLSKYEGLGLPVLEAGFAQKRMIVSDGGALPEFAPSWAFILPNQAELNSYGPQIKEYLEASPLIDQYYADKFTWASTAQRIRNQFQIMVRSSHE